VLWIKYDPEEASIPDGLSFLLDRSVVDNYWNQIKNCKHSYKKKWICGLLSTCGLGILCGFFCLIENSFQREMNSILDDFQKALGQDYFVRFLTLEKHNEPNDEYPLEWYMWLGIGYGQEAKTALNALESAPMQDCCTWCGAVDKYNVRIMP
jgi:hypothetical protein